MECEPITGVWGQSPQQGPGTEPLVGVRGQNNVKICTKSVLAHHTGRYQCTRVSDVLLAYDVFPVIYAGLAASWSPFQQRNCEIFQIAREKMMVTVTTTFKSGGDISPPSTAQFLPRPIHW